jgi:hypothetical protein
VNRALRFTLLGLAVVVLTASGSSVIPASAGQLGYRVAGITITADGVSPKSLVIRAGGVRFVPVWTNLDAVTHTVTFDYGRCVFTLAAGERMRGAGAGFLDICRNPPLPGQRPDRPRPARSSSCRTSAV